MGVIKSNRTFGELEVTRKAPHSFQVRTFSRARVMKISAANFWRQLETLGVSALDAHLASVEAAYLQAINDLPARIQALDKEVSPRVL